MLNKVVTQSEIGMKESLCYASNTWHHMAGENVESKVVCFCSAYYNDIENRVKHPVGTSGHSNGMLLAAGHFSIIVLNVPIDMSHQKGVTAQQTYATVSIVLVDYYETNGFKSTTSSIECLHI